MAGDFAFRWRCCGDVQEREDVDEKRSLLKDWEGLRKKKKLSLERLKTASIAETVLFSSVFKSPLVVVVEASLSCSSKGFETPQT